MTTLMHERTGRAARESRLRRLLIVTPRYLPEYGGVELHVREVGQRIASRGVEVTVATTDRSGRLPKLERDGRVEVRRARARPRRSDVCWAPQIADVVESGRFDLVHVQSIFTAVAPIAMRAARRARLPYLATFHGVGTHESRLRVGLRPLQFRLLAPLLRGASALVGLTGSEIEHYARVLGLPAEALTLIPNGADLPRLATGRRPGVGEPPLVASVGRLVRSKGHHRVLAAMPAVRAVHPGARLWIAGEGPEATALRAQADRLGIASDVEISSVAPDDRARMAERLSEAAVATLMSDGEGQPLAALEAASLGLPIVVSDRPGLRDLAADGIATCVDPDDTRETARALVRAIERGIGPAPTLPTWDGCAEHLLALYDDVLARSWGDR